MDFHPNIHQLPFSSNDINLIKEQILRSKGRKEQPKKYMAG